MHHIRKLKDFRGKKM
ncbi:hypothetical protein [Bacillus thuringiensis]